MAKETYARVTFVIEGKLKEIFKEKKELKKTCSFLEHPIIPKLYLYNDFISILLSLSLNCSISSVYFLFLIFLLK